MLLLITEVTNNIGDYFLTFSTDIVLINTLSHNPNYIFNPTVFLKVTYLHKDSMVVGEVCI